MQTRWQSHNSSFARCLSLTVEMVWAWWYSHNVPLVHAVLTDGLNAQGIPVPGSEILCIFDADQVAKPEFFLRTLPLFDSGDDVGMVLSPQCFHNLDYHTDIFNHSNRQFWEYMQPGYDAWGFISCTGDASKFLDCRPE